jgi:hypothetical protein
MHHPVPVLSYVILMLLSVTQLATLVLGYQIIGFRNGFLGLRFGHDLSGLEPCPIPSLRNYRWQLPVALGVIRNDPRAHICEPIDIFLWL